MIEINAGFKLKKKKESIEINAGFSSLEKKGKS